MEGLYVWILAMLLLNGYGFYLMGSDKNRAVKGRYRISEKTLWLTALFGAAAGMTIGMQVFRHKTRHLQFRLGLPALAVINIAVFVYIMNLLY
ncbi:DUF1294 domain-containing protein [Mesobacillus foraminis]|uniref:DUF1294 domain-containing protein n=1 Tax=Mesobacillus foraminis TaxID=279826 RepID=UPI0039A3CE1C